MHCPVFLPGLTQRRSPAEMQASRIPQISAADRQHVTFISTLHNNASASSLTTHDLRIRIPASLVPRHTGLTGHWLRAGTAPATKHPRVHRCNRSLKHQRAQIARAEARCSRCAAHPNMSPETSREVDTPIAPLLYFTSLPMFPLLALETICNRIANPSTRAMCHCALTLFQHLLWHFKYRIF